MGIDANYIKHIVENNRPEDITLDYKSTLKISSDSEKNELRYDVCAFINSSGGLIIFGIEESTADSPCKLLGLKELDDTNKDEIIQRIVQILSSSIEPKLPILDINFLDIDEKTILYINIPQSYTKPHAVIANDKYKFPQRFGNKRVDMNFQQVRNEILFSNDYAKLVRYFIDDRLSKIDTFDPNSLFSNPVQHQYKLVLHICPIEYFYSNTSQHKFDKTYIQTINIAAENPGEIYSLDGLYLVNYFNGYALINRNGSLEYVSYINHNFLSKDTLKDIIKCIHRSLLRFSLLNVKSSVIISLALIGAKGIKIYQHDQYPVREYIINTDYAHMPFIEIKSDTLEILSEGSTDPKNLYKDIYSSWIAIEPLFDFIYQSFGCSKSMVGVNDKGEFYCQ